MSVVLGIDPGTATLGWGLVREHGSDLSLVGCGAIRTPAHSPLHERLLAIHTELNELLHRHRPAALAVEKLFFTKNVTTGIAVAHARGVVLLVAAQAGLPIAEFTPMEVKQTLTGYGGADKQQMQTMVRLLLGLTDVPRPDDAADAVAVAICYHRLARYRQLADASGDS
ncbi:MAG TPA: crossover junction endodeoxyribonuclease RuvC [Chloroflexi bacterium]|nr:crossover junction endodeoxyribonuclease RuvC [Chloroflexota bacterium]